MAKIRRVIRKTAPRRIVDVFDEQLWPTYIALVVLGGFLMGVSAAYLKFTNTPWYANAVTWLCVIPLLIGGLMVAFQYIDNRLFRRSMQFSAVVAAIIHVLLVVQLRETVLFSQLLQPQKATTETVEKRKPKTLPEYHPSQLVPDEDRPLQDFEKPVQTPDPTPTPEQVTERETPPQETEPQVQPIPVKESDPVVKTTPNVVKQDRPNETNPRLDDQASKLSKQTTPSQMKVSNQVDTPQDSPAKTKPSLEAKPTEAVVQKQQAPSETPRRAPEAEPTSTNPQATPQIARTTPEKSPTPETSTTPTLKKAEAQPLKTPTTQVASNDSPSPSKQTTPDALTPHNTTTTKQTTAAPQVAKTTNDPNTQPTAEPTAAPQKRQSEAEVRPQVAQANVNTPNKQTRVTERPDTATSAAQVLPKVGGDVSSTQIALTPQKSATEKTAEASVTSAKPATVPSSEPNTARTEQPAARVARTEATDSPTATANPTQAPTATRQTGSAPSISATAQNVAVPQATTSAPTTGATAPTAVAVRRQENAAAEATARTGEPTPQQVATTASGASSTPVRRATPNGTTAAEAPSVTQDTAAIASSAKGATSQMPNVVTTAANVATNTSSKTSVNPQPGAASSLVSRQATDNAAGASRTQPSLEVAAAGPAATVSSPGASRAEASAVPTINAAASPSASPARSATAAEIASSPQAIDSPAARVADQGAGNPTATPSRLAVNKGLAGMAGGGQSPNMDNSSPNGASPAQTASASAKRAQSSQDTATGEALSPSSVAQVARSRAEAAVPQSSLEAQAIEVATTGGSQQVSEASASSGAALIRAASNAPNGAIAASKGTTEIDVGPTMIVADKGTGRADGGGQAFMNLETRSTQIARSEATGGASQIALAAPKVEAVAAAPAGDGGGQPKMDTPGPASFASARAVAGGQAATSGGPSAAAEKGPLAEEGTAALLAEANVSRADASGGSSGAAGAAGQPSVEDEEEKARRLARASVGGAPQIASSAAVVADVPASPMGDGADGGAPKVNIEAGAATTAIARTNADGGAPRGGAPASAAEAPGGSAPGGGEIVSAATVTKAEAASGASGPVLAGGGTASNQSKTATGPSFAANASADTVELAGAPQSSGSPNGAPLEATGLTAAKVAGGASGAATTGPVGAAAGDAPSIASTIGAAGQAVGKRQANSAEGGGPGVGDTANAGGPGKQAAQSSLPAGGGALVEVPQMGPKSAVAQAELDHMMGGMGAGAMSKQSGDAMAVNIEAKDGPGGLGVELTPRVGLNTRQARSDSVTVQIATSRFERQKVGGYLTVNTSAVTPTDSFRRRNSRNMGDKAGGDGRGSPPPQTEDAIEAGLAFLARYQKQDGRWKLQEFGEEEAALQADSAATALALLSFQGAGYHHREHKYKDVVRRGVEFLVRNQKDDGDLFLPLDDDSNRSVWLYSHSIATLALCEAYGMTQDPALKEPAQKALDFIVAAQHKERGGWRYSPGVGSDTSVTGWMMMALKSGELAELKVPKQTYDKIKLWLNASQESAQKPYLYRYNPYAPDTEEQRHGKATSKTMTTVGLLMRLYSGWKRDNPNMVAGAGYLKENLPQMGTAREPQRDTYYWYYGTQVMFHMGGEYWAAWNGRLHPLLIESQQKNGPLAGSWNPRGGIPDRWAPHAGRLYVTTMNLLCLEVYYRHLPLYDDTAK